MKRHPLGWAEGLADATVLGLGAWQAWATFCIRTGASFWVLLFGTPLAILSGVAVVRLLPWGGRRAPLPGPAVRESLLPELLGAGFASLAFVAWQLGYLWFHAAWLVAVVHLGICAWRAGSGPVHADTPGAARALGVVTAGIALLSIGVTWCVIRPDGDDGYYLGQVTGTLAHPELAVASFDVMHGDLTAPVQQPSHRAQSVELLVAVVCAALPFLEPASVYYLVFPAFFAVLFAVASALLAREIVGDRAAIPALVTTFGLAVVWGGRWASPANFALSRLFQGKSAFVCALAPLVVLAALRWARDPSWATWLRLLASMLASAALTSSALIVAPVAGALAVLGSLRWDRKSVLVALGGVASAFPSVLTLILVKLDMTHAAIEISGRTKDLEEIFGPDWRAPLTFIALVALPLAFRGGPSAVWAVRTTFLTFLLVLNHGTSMALAELAGTLFSWRLYWAIPFLVWMGAIVGSALAGPRPLRWLQAGAVIWFVTFGLSGPWIGSADNAAGVSWPRWDVDLDEQRIADRAVAVSNPDDLILLHHHLAIRSTRHVERPRLVGVRKLYLAHLRPHFGRRETRLRRDLLAFTSGALVKGRATWALSEMDRRCIKVLGAHERLTDTYEGIEEKLAARGWKRDLEAGRYVLWIRESCPERGAITGPRRGPSRTPVTEEPPHDRARQAPAVEVSPGDLL